MRITKNRLISTAATLVAAATTLTVAVMDSPAHAVAGQWVPSVGNTPIYPGAQFDVTGTVALSGTFNGNYTTLTCVFAPGDVTITAPNLVPTASPGGTISLPVTLPTSLSSAANPVCVDSTFGMGIDVTSNGVDWTINVRMPSGTAPSPYLGPLNWSLDIPANALRIENPLFYPDCAVDAPSAADTIVGTYNAGTVTPSGLPHPFNAAASGSCTIDTDQRLDQADLEVSPPITVKYVP